MQFRRGVDHGDLIHDVEVDLQIPRRKLTSSIFLHLPALRARVALRLIKGKRIEKMASFKLQSAF